MDPLVFRPEPDPVVLGLGMQTPPTASHVQGAEHTADFSAAATILAGGGASRALRGREVE